MFTICDEDGKPVSIEISDDLGAGICLGDNCVVWEEEEDAAEIARQLKGLYEKKMVLSVREVTLQVGKVVLYDSQLDEGDEDDDE